MFENDFFNSYIKLMIMIQVLTVLYNKLKKGNHRTTIGLSKPNCSIQFDLVQIDALKFINVNQPKPIQLIRLINFFPSIQSLNPITPLADKALLSVITS